MSPLPCKNGVIMQRYLPGILAMAAIVVASNILVQHLFGQWLTWGAFTYPFAFLVTDVTNRLQGAVITSYSIHYTKLYEPEPSATRKLTSGPYSPMI